VGWIKTKYGFEVEIHNLKPGTYEQVSLFPNETFFIFLLCLLDENLKKYYMKSQRFIFPIPWKDDWTILFNESYVEMNLRKIR
jgi:hypothetical protein